MPPTPPQPPQQFVLKSASLSTNTATNDHTSRTIDAPLVDEDLIELLTANSRGQNSTTAVIPIKDISSSTPLPSVRSARFYRWRMATLMSLIVTYLAYFFVRSHLAVTLPQIQLSTGLTKPQLGMIISFGYGAQSVGKLVNGYIIDRFGGKAMLLGSLGAAIVVSALFGFAGMRFEQQQQQTGAMASTPTSDTSSSSSDDTALSTLLTTLTVLWAANRFFQSTAWGSILKILPHWFGPREYGRVLGLFALSYGFGDAGIRLLLGALAAATTTTTITTTSATTTTTTTATFAWYHVWWVGCGLACLLGLPGYWLIQSSPKRVGELPLDDAKATTTLNTTTTTAAIKASATIDDSNNSGDNNNSRRTIHHHTQDGTSAGTTATTITTATTWQRMRPILSKGQFWLVIALYVGLTLIRETFLSWTAQFLRDHLGLSNDAAGMCSLVIPLFAAISAMLGGILIDKVSTTKASSSATTTTTTSSSDDASGDRKEYVTLGFLVVGLTAIGWLAVDTSATTDSTTQPAPRPGLSLFLLAMVAFGLEAPYTFIDGIYTLQLAGQESAAMTVGIIQAAGNAGAIGSGYFIGWLSDRYGWGVLLGMLAGVLVLLVIIVALNILYRRRLGQRRRQSRPQHDAPRTSGNYIEMTE